MLSIADIKTAVKNKVPLVRSSTFNWVTFCIETSNKAVILKVHKDYVPILMECLNDGTPDVREAAFSALAAIAKLVGMRPLERSLEKLDDVRRKKLSEMISGSEGGTSTNTNSAVQASGATASSHEVIYFLYNGFMEVKEQFYVERLHASDASFFKKSAASMLSWKRPYQAAVSS
ncbi:protein MOR1-like [Humulus lupulus]|uniref:protein MOR1-like n=1 Tax=Humulus lupulus TaxID=3486 RepID=UPI002B40F5F7|nr:protein MOR1-like [Humulus lupulus]